MLSTKQGGGTPSNAKKPQSRGSGALLDRFVGGVETDQANVVDGASGRCDGAFER